MKRQPKPPAPPPPADWRAAAEEIGRQAFEAATAEPPAPAPPPWWENLKGIPMKTPQPTSLPTVVSIAGRPRPLDSLHLRSLLTRRKLLAETRQNLERLEKELDEDMDAFASNLGV